MKRLEVIKLKEQVDKLWSESKKGEQKALDLIQAHYGYKRLQWGIQYNHLAPVTDVTNYLLKDLIHTNINDDERRDFLLNKFDINTSSATTPLLDISKGKEHSRFIDAFDLYKVIDSIESNMESQDSKTPVFINGKAKQI